MRWWRFVCGGREGGGWEWEWGWGRGALDHSEVHDAVYHALHYRTGNDKGACLCSEWQCKRWTDDDSDQRLCCSPTHTPLTLLPYPIAICFCGQLCKRPHRSHDCQGEKDGRPQIRKKRSSPPSSIPLVENSVFPRMILKAHDNLFNDDALFDNVRYTLYECPSTRQDRRVVSALAPCLVAWKLVLEEWAKESHSFLTLPSQSPSYPLLALSFAGCRRFRRS